MMIRAITKRAAKQYDVTIFQTPKYRDNKGYKAVYRIMIHANSRKSCLEETFSRFNVTDRIPANYPGRFLTTGDIVLIDEGRAGHFYFQLKPGGWQPINRIHIR
nr:YodL domain-containing protein [Neobacillus sp. Marseille-Q6967]